MDEPKRYSIEEFCLEAGKEYFSETEEWDWSQVVPLLDREDFFYTNEPYINHLEKEIERLDKKCWEYHKVNVEWELKYNLDVENSVIQQETIAKLREALEFYIKGDCNEVSVARTALKECFGQE